MKPPHMIFQVTNEDIIRHDLDPNDLGTWCWVMNGCIQGFARSRDDARDMLDRAFPPRVIYVQD